MHGSYVNTVCISKNDDIVASGGFDHKIRI